MGKRRKGKREREEKWKGEGEERKGKGRREESSEFSQDLLQRNYWLFQIFQSRQKPI